MHLYVEYDICRCIVRSEPMHLCLLCHEMVAPRYILAYGCHLYPFGACSDNVRFASPARFIKISSLMMKPRMDNA